MHQSLVMKEQLTAKVRNTNIFICQLMSFGAATTQFFENSDMISTGVHENFPGQRMPAA